MKIEVVLQLMVLKVKQCLLYEILMFWILILVPALLN